MIDKSGYLARRTVVTDENIKKILSENLQLWEEYKRDMRLRKGKNAEKTLKTYKSAILAFMIWLSENYKDKKFIDIDHKVVKNYLYYCQEELSNHGRVRNTKTAAISSLINYCVREDYIKYNPLDKKLKRAETATEQIIDQPFLVEDQVQELRDKINEIEEYEKRMMYALYFELSFSTAARVSAVYQFSEDNLELENRRFMDIKEKRAKIREMYFNTKAQELLKEWIEYKKINNINTPAIFFSKQDGKYVFMSVRNLQFIAKKLGMMIGVDLHTHSFRKAFSNISKTKGVELLIISEKLGHESSDTTSKYYLKKDEKKTQDTLDKFEI